MKKLVIIFLLLSSTVSLARDKNCQPYYGKSTDRWTNCYGSAVWPNGETYVGQWLNGMKHGQGRAVLSRGLFDILKGDGKETYNGEWRRNKRNGFGTNYWPSGDKYVGYWFEDNGHGEGIKTYTDGSTEEGVWEHGHFKYAKTVIYANTIDLNKKNFEEERNRKSKKYKPKGKSKEYLERERIAKQKAEKLGARLKKEKEERREAQLKKQRIAAEKKRKEDNKILMAGSGSGFAVSDLGYVVTNNHVTEFCNDVYIQHQGKTIPATVISTDSKNDLALLKADIKPARVFTLSRKSKIMQKIYAAGFPFGKDISSSVVITDGIISSLSGLGDNFSNIQITAPIQPGNSGGPIVDDKGNVVGVVVSKLVLENTSVVPENTNFGIKSNVVVDFLESNGVKLKTSNSENMSTEKLGEIITEATYFLSCHMTWANIKKYQSQKVMFENLLNE